MSAEQGTGKTSVMRAGEWIAALIGAVNCILVSMLFARSAGADFPFPALYLIEIALVGVLVLMFVAARPGLKGRSSALPWVAAGIMLAFVVLGGFSIGPFLIPAFLAFLVTGILVDWPPGGAMARRAGVLLVAVVVQAAIMGLMIYITP
jgi:hypothetical protein